MSTVPARPEVTPLGVLRQQFAPKATDDDLAYFAQVARHLDVDPWAGHICLIPYYVDGQRVHRPQLTVAGRRWIAQRTGRLRGIEGPYWCGQRQYTADGAKLPLEWLEVWDDDDDYPYAARCLVYPADWTQPANGTVKWAEFAQMTKKGTHEELTASWAKMPSHMLGKVAESLALRRAFSEVQAAVSYLGGDDEDATVLREVAAESFATVAPGDPPAVTAGEVRAAGGTRSTHPSATARAEAERVPDHVYDQTPEARGWR
ncbi:MAG TPA: recombinase RecT [Acidimicrobiales bacterium]|jgi:hypothetical protein